MSKLKSSYGLIPIGGRNYPFALGLKSMEKFYKAKGFTFSEMAAPNFWDRIDYDDIKLLIYYGLVEGCEAVGGTWSHSQLAVNTWIDQDPQLQQRMLTTLQKHKPQGAVSKIKGMFNI